MSGASKESSSGGVAYYPGQFGALEGIFAPGGTYSQFMAGKPNPGFERAQSNALQVLQNKQAQSGVLNTPLGTRQQADFLQRSTQAQGDDWLKTLFAFMQPAGQKSKGSKSSQGLIDGMITPGIGTM